MLAGRSCSYSAATYVSAAAVSTADVLIASFTNFI